MERLNDVVTIPVEDILVNPNQPRKVFNENELNELALSIKSYGVLQPVTVTESEDKFILVMGERRLRASRIAGLKQIPAIIIDIEEFDSAVVALVENIQRKDLNFIEEAQSYSQLISKFGLTQEQVAKRVGKTQSTVSNKMRILNLGDKTLEVLVENSLTERHGRALLKVKDENLRDEVISRVIKKSLTVKETEKLIEKTLDDKKKKNFRLSGNLNYRIYLNTFKSAFKTIENIGGDVDYSEKDNGDHIEIVVKIPK